MNPKRKRLLYLLALVCVIAMGLLSRQSFVPTLIYPYTGDAFYAMMIYAVLATLFPAKKPHSLFLLSVAICYAIELSQLYQADWINAIRHNRLGGLVLGFGFLWSDLVSYLVGAAVAFGIESVLLRKRLPKK